MNNPYDPKRYYEKPPCRCCGQGGYRAGLEQLAVLAPEIRREASRKRYWEAGRRDRLEGKPCGDTNGAYLEGWYSVN